MANSSGKLEVLNKSQFDNSYLHYPSKLSTSSRMTHYVQFAISVPEKSNYSNFVRQESGNDFLGTPKASGNVGKGVIQNAVQTILEPQRTQLSDIIYMYMPDTISTAQSADYTTISAADTFKYFATGAELAQRSKSIMDQNIPLTQSFRTLSSDPMAVGSLAKGGKSVGLLGNGAEKFIIGKMGYALNPMMEVFFDNMGFRTFQFDFLFAPKNKDEAATVRKIIELFKFHQSPEIDTNGVGRYFIVPSLFDIKFYFNGQENTNINKIATSVLTTAYVDYAPTGWVAMEDGMPAQTRLTLGFKEIEIMTKSKIKEGY